MSVKGHEDPQDRAELMRDRKIVGRMQKDKETSQRKGQEIGKRKVSVKLMSIRNRSSGMDDSTQNQPKHEQRDQADGIHERKKMEQGMYGGISKADS